ncbi:hypothetical protein OS42_23540 [Dickeya oryzae]
MYIQVFNDLKKIALPERIAVCRVFLRLSINVIKFFIIVYSIVIDVIRFILLMMVAGCISE